eukprot:SAG22_NODE_2368_length_2652_cov_2.835096_2_plen_141_part_00
MPLTRKYHPQTFLSRPAGQPGLEIQLRSGEWVSVVPPENCLVVNIGDLLARWSNDRWRATMHRVANPPPRQHPVAEAEAEADDSALSVVFFSGPHPDTVVECLPSTKCRGDGPDRVAKYPPVTAAEHVRQKIELAAGIGT